MTIAEFQTGSTGEGDSWSMTHTHTHTHTHTEGDEMSPVSTLTGSKPIVVPDQFRCPELVRVPASRKRVPCGGQCYIIDGFLACSKCSAKLRKPGNIETLAASYPQFVIVPGSVGKAKLAANVDKLVNKNNKANVT